MLVTQSTTPRYKLAFAADYTYVHGTFGAWRFGIENMWVGWQIRKKKKVYSTFLSYRNHLCLFQRFAAVIMRIREPKTTALIFASGKMVVTGAKSEDDSKLASRKYARIIQKLGFPAKFTDFKIQNIVGSCDVKFPIRLEGLAFSHGPFTSVSYHHEIIYSATARVIMLLTLYHFDVPNKQYEPELFPGLIYRMVKPKIVLLIFVSGKIVLTGAKVRERERESHCVIRWSFTRL